MIRLTIGRVQIYQFLIKIFCHLPDQQLITMIRSNELGDVLDLFNHLNQPVFQDSIADIISYQLSVKAKPDNEVLNGLSVDRTKIMRGIGDGNTKPPHESVYRNNNNIEEYILGIKRFYRKSGLLPDETVHESPDYLCVELDFMRELCMRELEQWGSDMNASETMSMEEEFLRKHLGIWVKEFCDNVKLQCKTDFYRGFTSILGSFIKIDMKYVHELLSSLHTN